MGFVTPTEVQARAIPPLRRGEDLIGQAQTGTGKTAAFGIPIVEKIDPSSSHVQALILTPTRELCVQVDRRDRAHRPVPRRAHRRHLRRLGHGPPDRGPQARRAGRGRDAGPRARPHPPPRAAARPGQHRHPRRGRPHARHGLHRRRRDDPRPLAAERQTALFSATMPYAILRICDRFMKPNPAHVTVRPDLRTVETVRQLVYFVAEQDKVAALVELNEHYGFDRLLVFRHTQIGVDRLAATLKRRGKNVAALHGGLSQRERDRTLAAFRAGKIQFLIATNVASRGLDITDLPYVLSFDIPEDADTYVHRIGRTGRAGARGDRHHVRRRVGPRRLGGDPRRGRGQGRGRPSSTSTAARVGADEPSQRRCDAGPAWMAFEPRGSSRLRRSLVALGPGRRARSWAPPRSPVDAPQRAATMADGPSRSSIGETARRRAARSAAPTRLEPLETSGEPSSVAVPERRRPREVDRQRRRERSLGPARTPARRGRGRLRRFTHYIAARHPTIRSASSPTTGEAASPGAVAGCGGDGPRVRD